MKKYLVEYRAWGIEQGGQIVEAPTKAEAKRIVKSMFTKEAGYSSDIRVTFQKVEEMI